MKIQKGRMQENGGEKAESLQLDKDVTFILCFVHENNYITNFNSLGIGVNQFPTSNFLSRGLPSSSLRCWCSLGFYEASLSLLTLHILPI